MTRTAALRRTILVIGVLATLGLAAVTVEAASRWTASKAPLEQGPASLQSIQQALAAQQSRSAILEDQLGTMRTASDDLATALTAANDQVATDQATADALRASLAAAQAKLAKLEAALNAHRRTVVTTTSGSGVTPGPTTAPILDDDGTVDD